MFDPATLNRAAIGLSAAAETLPKILEALNRSVELETQILETLQRIEGDAVFPEFLPVWRNYQELVTYLASAPVGTRQILAYQPES